MELYGKGEEREGSWRGWELKGRGAEGVGAGRKGT